MEEPNPGERKYFRKKFRIFLERKKELLPLPPRKGIKFWNSFEREAGDSD